MLCKIMPKIKDPEKMRIIERLFCPYLSKWIDDNIKIEAIKAWMGRGIIFFSFMAILFC